MITNIFYCKPNIKCKTIESYRLKRREELMNRIEEPVCEKICHVQQPVSEPKVEATRAACSNQLSLKVRRSILKKKTDPVTCSNVNKQLNNKVVNHEENEEIPPRFESFIQRNINKVILSVPKGSPTHFIDDRYGHKQKKSSVQVKKKLQISDSKDRNTSILNKFKNKKYQIGDECSDHDLKKQANLMKLEKDTICSLLENLKEKWQVLYRSYVTMPFSHSMEKKRTRTVKIEQELREVESLIDLLEKNENIYIGNE